MEINRRNVLAGLGGLAVGGGGLLGSGAFSSVSANRDVEVNVLTDDSIAASDDIADVLVNVGDYNTVAVDDGSVNSSGSGLFPDSTEITGITNGEGTYSTKWVSLIENDVTLVFGPSGEELPPNSTTSYDNLIALVNSNDSGTNQGHYLDFDNSGFSNASVSFPNGAPSGVNVGANGDELYNVAVNAGDSSESGGTLEISIGASI